MNKHLICLSGISGSGKSTLAQKLIKEHLTKDDKVAHVSADFYWLRPDGLYDWNPKNIGRAHSWCQGKCEWYMKEEYSLVIVDNTNLTSQDRRPYELLAEKYGYLFEIKEPSTEWKYNAQICSEKNTHGVPLEACQRMLAKLKNDSTNT